MSQAAIRRIFVVEDDDLVSTVSSDEATLDELLEYADGDGVVCYELMIATDVDMMAICNALDIEPTSDHDVADADAVVLFWDAEAVERAADILSDQIKDATEFAGALCRFIDKTFDEDQPADVGEVVEVLEEADRGYQPGPTAHTAVVAGALLRRLMSALRAGKRRDASVIMI